MESLRRSRVYHADPAAPRVSAARTARNEVGSQEVFSGIAPALLHPGGSVKARRAASIALAAALLIGTAGCTLTAVQGTQVPYQPSDGTAATIGDIDLRNVLGLSEDGKSVALILTVINHGSNEQTLNLQYENAAGEKKTQKVKVDGDS